MKLLKKLIVIGCTLVASNIWGAAKNDSESKPFVILITSYNNEKYAEENIKSALTQKYNNYRIIFVNDCSSDNTLQIVKQTIDQYNAWNIVTLIDNQERKLGLKNYYEVIHEKTRDEEIIVNLDGDDFLANRNVLTVLNSVYSNSKKEIWFTYGKFLGLSRNIIDWNVVPPADVISENAYRSFQRVPTHLRTYYSWLFKRIKKEDFMYQDKFFEMAWDMAYVFPILEMSSGRFSLINRYLYIYNDGNPINDHKVNVDMQRFYDKYIRDLPRYKGLKHNKFKTCKESDCILCNEKIKDKVYQELQ